MGFSLVGFGAGLAESAIERIEEERKFSNLALQGRIERASVLKMQRDKEAEALRKELLEQKASLQQFGIDDPEVQKAYLTVPTLAEALKKSLSSGEVKVENANQYARQFANINKDKLQSGTVDEFIASAYQAARGGGKVEPARVMPTEGGSMLAPTTSAQQRRLEQLASARGMSLEDLARAESPAAMGRPEPAASINLEMLRKPDRLSSEDQLKRLEADANKAAITFGEKDPRTNEARMLFNKYATAMANTRSLNPAQKTHKENLDRAYAIKYDPNSTASPEEKKWANDYVNNYNADKRKDSADDRTPSAQSLASSFRSRAIQAVRQKYGSREGFAERVIDLGNGEKLYDLEPTDKNPEVRVEVLTTRQRGALSHSEVLAEMQSNNGRILDRKIRSALSELGIDFSNNGEPILANRKTLAQILQEEKGSAAPSVPTSTSSVQSTPNRSPAMVPPKPATVPDAGRAGQDGAPTAQKTMTMADVAATAKASKLSQEQVIEAARRKGYTIIQ